MTTTKIVMAVQRDGLVSDPYRNPTNSSLNKSRLHCPHLPLAAANTMISLQLGNLYLLFAAVFIIVCFFASPGVAKAFLCLGAVADISHIYASYVGMGNALFWDVGRWNVMAWGNVGASAFLCANRILTVTGAFGDAAGFERLKKDSERLQRQKEGESQK